MTWTKLVKAVEDDIGATILPVPDNSKVMTTMVHKVIILLEKPTFVGVYVDSFQYIYSSYKKTSVSYARLACYEFAM